MCLISVCKDFFSFVSLSACADVSERSYLTPANGMALRASQFSENSGCKTGSNVVNMFL